MTTCDSATSMKGVVEQEVRRLEVWKEAQAHKVQCPSCDRWMTVRTLRWRHTCRRPITISRTEVGGMVDELTSRALRAFQERASRLGGPRDGRSDEQP